ncbi:MAG: biotin--[acetyl-CoA-carboxylase] ligase [Lachnospiraceae bacterium]|nr:biotin--[acetyl-CoA-carboxylase] ligase [Lachnospiraceae bacterium]
MPKNVKEQVLTILNKYKGEYKSGEELASDIGVSRTAVWKAINTLREQGFNIQGSTKSGYILSSDTDILDKEAIAASLSEGAAAFYEIECVKEIDSTNDELKRRAFSYEKEGLTIIAESQTKGKGRRGRSFFSPNNTGLYLSVLLRPDLSVEDSVLITTLASVAGARAVEDVNSSLKPGDVKIKWVNDLFLEGKKISGILTEGNISMETGKLDYAVLGIGFNLEIPEGTWPSDIADTAGSIFNKKAPAGTRNALATAFLNLFLDYYKKLPKLDYLDEYRNRQLTIDKNIRVITAAGERKAKCLGVNDRCELMVRFDGESEDTTLNSGEISIRM